MSSSSDPSSSRPAAGPGKVDATAPSTERARGRELVLAALCHLEAFQGAEARSDALEVFWKEAPRDDEGRAITVALGGKAADAAARNYARRLLETVIERWDEIDAELENVSRRWRLARMDKIDRNALRLGAAELRSSTRVPPKVVVAEAVRVASRYGSERSGKFVNGVLSDLAARVGDDSDDGTPRHGDDT